MAKYEIVCQRCGKAFDAERRDALRCATCRTLNSRDGKVIEKKGQAAMAALEKLLIEFGKPHRQTLVQLWLQQIEQQIKNHIRDNDK